MSRIANRGVRRDNSFSYLMQRVLLVNPNLAKLSPKTQAALDKFRAKGTNNICTKESPMPEFYRISDNWKHPDAKFRERDGDTHDDYKCPHCGIHLSIEIRNGHPIL